jgi:hypothetical protein
MNDDRQLIVATGLTLVALVLGVGALLTQRRRNALSKKLFFAAVASLVAAIALTELR